MRLNKERLVKGELIGLRLEVPLTGTKGRIIDETKHCLEILTEKKQRKKVLKNQKIIFSIDGKKVMANGKILEHKSEERTKKAKW